LLHDIDVEICSGDMSQHSRVGADMVLAMGGSVDMVHAILTHNEAHGIPCESLMDKALYCADPLTGLITAAVLVRPRQKIIRIGTSQRMQALQRKEFCCRGIARANCLLFTNMVDIEEFIALGLRAMQGISDDLGL